MVKPEKFGHLHLVYHFTVPLKGYTSYALKSTISDLNFISFSNMFWGKTFYAYICLIREASQTFTVLSE